MKCMARSRVVYRDDHLGTGTDRCGQYVPVIGVGQLERVDERLVVGDQAIPDGANHQRSRTCQALGIQVG